MVGSLYSLLNTELPIAKEFVHVLSCMHLLEPRVLHFDTWLAQYI